MGCILTLLRGLERVVPSTFQTPRLDFWRASGRWLSGETRSPHTLRSQESSHSEDNLRILGWWVRLIAPLPILKYSLSLLVATDKPVELRSTDSRGRLSPHGCFREPRHHQILEGGAQPGDYPPRHQAGGYSRTLSDLYLVQGLK